MSSSETGGTAPALPDPCVGEPPTRPRLLIAEDHQVVAEAFRRLLEPAYRVVGLALSGSELLTLLNATRADCLLLDLGLPDVSALELLPTIAQAFPQVRVVVLTMYEDRILADACLAAGADGFVPKMASANEVLHAISEVLSGRRYLSPRIPKTSHGVGVAARHPGLWRLTPRQHEVIRLVGEGRRPAEIAASLGLSRSAVTLHIKHIMRALGITPWHALLRFAVLVGSESHEGDASRDEVEQTNRTAIS